jgi:hypothetical protein
MEALKLPHEEVEDDKQESQQEDDCSVESQQEDDCSAVLDRLEQTRIERVESFYTPLVSILGISNGVMETRAWDDATFVDQMTEDEYLFLTVRKMFENAREHVATNPNPDECSTIKTVVKALQRRADYFTELAKEVRRHTFSSEIITKAYGETQAFMLMLEPFVLNEEEICREDLLFTHFHDITIIFARVKRVFAVLINVDVTTASEDIKTGAVASEDSSQSVVPITQCMTVETGSRPTTSYGRGPPDTESTLRPVTSDGGRKRATPSTEEDDDEMTGVFDCMTVETGSRPTTSYGRGRPDTESRADDEMTGVSTVEGVDYTESTKRPVTREGRDNK